MKKLPIALSLVMLLGGVSFGQSGNRTFGSQQLQLDDNNPAHARIYLTTVNGSLGIDQTGVPAPGVFPSACAILDLSSTTQGFLAPRMTTAQEALICGGTPPEGLIVYNLTTHSLDVWNGSSWGQSWSTKGNSGTNPATDFLGTKDNVDLVLRTNNTERVRVLANGTINIPTTAAAGPGIVTQNGTRFIHSFGTNNLFSGANAGNLSTTGAQNTGTGVQALQANTTGNNNTATGYQSGFANTGGNGNTAVGSQSLLNNAGGSDNTAIGFSAAAIASAASNVTAVGSGALMNNVATGNTAVGYHALQNNVNAGTNTAVGFQALQTTVIGGGNTAVGSGSLQVNTADQNTAVGWGALAHNVGGTANVATGVSTLLSNTAGNSNVAYGNFALEFNQTGSDNTAVGTLSGGLANVSGSSNTFLGSHAIATVDGLTNSTAIGANAQVSQSNSIVLGSGQFVGIGIPNPGTLFTNANTNMVDQGGDGETGGSMQWLYNSNGYAASFQNVNSAVVNPHGVLVKAAKTTSGTRVFVANSGAGNGIDRFTVQGDGAVIVGGGGTLNVSNSTLTNNVSVVNGIADATVASTAANTVWDSRVNGDQLVTGVQKIGGSIWMDGTSNPHQIVTDQNVNIGTKNNTTAAIVTNGSQRITVDGAGNTNLNGPTQVNNNFAVTGSATLGSGSSTISRVFRFTLAIGGTTLGAGSSIVYTSVAVLGSNLDPIFGGVDDAIMSSGVISASYWVDAGGHVNLRLVNNGGGNATWGNSAFNFTIIK